MRTLGEAVRVDMGGTVSWGGWGYVVRYLGDHFKLNGWEYVGGEMWVSVVCWVGEAM